LAVLQGRKTDAMLRRDLFLLTKKEISRSDLALSIHGIQAALVFCISNCKRQASTQRVLFSINYLTPGKRTKSLGKAMPSVTESQSIST